MNAKIDCLGGFRPNRRGESCQGFALDLQPEEGTGTESVPVAGRSLSEPGKGWLAVRSHQIPLHRICFSVIHCKIFFLRL